MKLLNLLFIMLLSFKSYSYEITDLGNFKSNGLEVKVKAPSSILYQEYLNNYFKVDLRWFTGFSILVFKQLSIKSTAYKDFPLEILFSDNENHFSRHSGNHQKYKKIIIGPRNKTIQSLRKTVLHELGHHLQATLSSNMLEQYADMEELAHLLDGTKPVGSIEDLGRMSLGLTFFDIFSDFSEPFSEYAADLIPLFRFKDPLAIEAGQFSRDFSKANTDYNNFYPDKGNYHNYLNPLRGITWKIIEPSIKSVKENVKFATKIYKHGFTLLNIGFKKIYFDFARSNLLAKESYILDVHEYNKFFFERLKR